MTVARGPRARGLTALLTRLAGDRAADRVFRALAFGFLPGALVFGALAVPTLAAQARDFPAAWNIAAFTALLAPSIVFGSLAFTAPVRVIRLLARVAVGAGLAVQATMPLMLEPHRSVGDAAWIDQLTALPVIAAVLAVRPAAAAVVAVSGSALTFVDRLVADPGAGAVVATQNALYVLLFSITFIALGVNSLTASRAEDVAGEDALRAATAAAVDEARDRERARINALVHDRVLAVLLTAARQIPGTAQLERADAARALEGLEALLREDAPAVALRGEAVVWHLQAIATDIAPEAQFGYDVSADLEVPGDAVEALSAATEESLRNSLRHAGDHVNRAVHVIVAAGGVRVDVLDDGVGFERGRVPATRLGISESIERRMRALHGGAALLVAAPGVGTRVQLDWRPA